MLEYASSRSLAPGSVRNAIWRDSEPELFDLVEIADQIADAAIQRFGDLHQTREG